jgi:2-C-methyl-D-erythritol 4-phosphate cytidylyltransferase
VLAQTPQVFRYDLLRARSKPRARDGFTGTDESSLVERLDQVEVSVVLGSDRNIKITGPAIWIWRGCSWRGNREA